MSIFDDIYDAGKTVVDGAGELAKDAVDEIEVLGDAVVDGAKMIGDEIVDGTTMIGDKLVTFGSGAVKWTIAATGDAIEWSKTSYAEVAEWTENAAGDVANFTVEGYQVARGALETAGKWIYEQLANYFYETLPELGGLDPKAREVAAYLLSDPVARGIEALADTMGCVITFGVKLKAVSSLNIGIYACGGGWGFFVDSRFDSLQEMISSPSLSVGVSAQVTMVFGPVSRASKAKALKFGLGMKTSPAKKLSLSVGGVVLMEASAPPLFLGVRYAMDLDLALFGKKKTVDEAGKLKWKVKVQAPKPNGDFVTDALGFAGDVAEIGWEELTSGLSAQATNFDAALRAQADPATADRIQATALAAAVSLFKPRYYGAVRTLKGQTVSGTSQGAVGINLAGNRTTVQIVAGLTDPTAVSFEMVGEPPLYWCAQASGDVTLVPYDKRLDLRGTTFRMVRGLAGQGVSFAVASDGTQNPRFLVATRVRGGIVTPTPVFCAERMNGIEAPTREDATFLLDRPLDQPDTQGPILRPGQFLRINEYKRSPSGMYSVVLADNGRLVVRQRGNGSLTDPSTWFLYQPGMIQDEEYPWAWASPAPAAAGPCHAYVSYDGRLSVRAGADPASAGATLWQSDVLGTPGPCFMTITNAGLVMLMRGTPEAPDEMVWSSPTGALYWPTRRRQVVLQFGGKFVQANNGGGVNKPGVAVPFEPLVVRGTTVGGWEAFELQELATGHVALRAQGRRYVGVQDGGVGLVCLRDHVGPRELFTLELLGGGNGQAQAIRLRSAATGAYVRMYTMQLLGQTLGVDALTADGSPGQAAAFKLMDVEHDLTAHSGRLVHVVAQHSGKALEVPNGYDDNGRGLVQGEFFGADHQKWALTHTGGGWFTLTNHQTGKAIDINGAQTSNGAIALQWPLHGGDNQRFALTPTGDGHYIITAKHSGQALDVEGGTLASGGRVLQWPLHGGANQKWKITLAPAGRRSPWTALGGSLASEPSIASTAPGRLDVVGRGPNDVMSQLYFDGQWRPWFPHTGLFFDGPCAVAPPGQPGLRLDIFCRGRDNGVYQRWVQNNQWSNWVALGGATSATPVALVPRPGRWDIFMLGTDKAIWHRYADNGWSGWISLGGGLLDPPAVLCRDGRYDVFARGLDNSLYQNTFLGGKWLGWALHGGQFTGRITAVSTAPDCYDVFGRGTDGALWSRILRNGQWYWEKLDGQLGSDPIALSVAADRIDVLARGSDGALWHRRQSATKWLPWVRLGLQIAGRPALTSSAPGQVDIAVTLADKSLWHHRLDG